MFNLDLQTILAHLAAVVAGGGGLWASVWLAKRLKPALGGQTILLRVGGMVLAALGTVATKAASGQLEGADLQTALSTLLEAAAVWVTAHATHKALKKL